MLSHIKSMQSLFLKFKQRHLQLVGKSAQSRPTSAAELIKSRSQSKSSSTQPRTKGQGFEAETGSNYSQRFDSIKQNLIK